MATDAGLVEPFKTQVDQLIAAAGGRVTIESGYRTYQQQLELRRENGCPDPLHSPPDACRIPTAIPGTSKHERGEAVDFGGDLTYAAQLAPRFHLIRTVPGEAWHYELDPAWHPAPTPPRQEPTDMLILIHANNVYLLHAGKIVYIGNPGDVDPALGQWKIIDDNDWARLTRAFPLVA